MLAGSRLHTAPLSITNLLILGGFFIFKSILSTLLSTGKAMSSLHNSENQPVY